MIGIYIIGGIAIVLWLMVIVSIIIWKITPQETSEQMSKRIADWHISMAPTYERHKALKDAGEWDYNYSQPQFMTSGN